MFKLFFEKIGIDPRAIKTLLLTHSDVDHVGGVDRSNKNYLYPNAQMYIGKGEENYFAGHVCYIIDDKILFSGDCLAVNENGGYSLFDFFYAEPGPE